MSLLAQCGNSAAIACWQLNLHYVPRACSPSAANMSRTSCVGGSRKTCTGGMCFTSAIWNDVNESSRYKQFDLGVPKAFKSSFSVYGLESEDGLELCRTGLRHKLVTGNGKFHSILNKRGIVIRCSIDVPVTSYGDSQMDPVGKINGEQQSMKPSSTGREDRTDSRGPLKAAFFDVDGTITGTNVVLAYFAVRMSEMSYLRKLFWIPCFAVLCIFYLLVDNFDRATFNRIFYAIHYKGRSADSKSSLAALVYERYYKPRVFAGALEHIRELKRLGYRIVLVTGALDFQIAPLARELEADFVYAAELVEENGRDRLEVVYRRAVQDVSLNCQMHPCSEFFIAKCDFESRFTGKLNGMATSNSEKAERVLDYAKRFDVSLEDSLAFGDSIADISMLEMVGRPHAVNPDARLLAIALQRKWTVLSWSRQTLNGTTAAEPLPA